MDLSNVDSFNFPGQRDPVTVRLLNLIKETNYELVQENGQRRMTAPEVTRDRSRDKIKGAEIFVGRLPRDCYEDEIIPVLARVGRVMELRLMLDFSGSNRGYAFALYENSAVARRACQELDGYEIRSGHRIGVVKSINNCRLFFGGVPKEKTKAEFMEELSKILEGITEIYLYPSAMDKKLNRGFLFVEFKDHRSAAMARRRLIPGRVILWDHEIAVDWADPEPGDAVEDDVMESVTALFVRNLSLDVPQQVVREIFQKATRIPIMKIKKINHFAFVHYENRELAQRVMDTMTKAGGVAEKEAWEISWAKPIKATKMKERERYINDAVASVSGKGESKSKTVAQPREKKNKGRKVSKAGNRERMDYWAELQQFAHENLGAVALHQYFESADGAGYVCKIVVIRENLVLFQFQSDLYRTQQEAMEATSRDVYCRLKNILHDSALGENQLGVIPTGRDVARDYEYNTGPFPFHQREICADS